MIAVGMGWPFRDGLRAKAETRHIVIVSFLVTGK